MRSFFLFCFVVMITQTYIKKYLSICFKILLHVWATRKICCKHQEIEKKAKKYSNRFEFAVEFLQHIFCGNLHNATWFEYGQRAAFFIHNQQSKKSLSETCIVQCIIFFYDISYNIFLHNTVSLDKTTLHHTSNQYFTPV